MEHLRREQTLFAVWCMKLICRTEAETEVRGDDHFKTEDKVFICTSQNTFFCFSLVKSVQSAFLYKSSQNPRQTNFFQAWNIHSFWKAILFSLKAFVFQFVGSCWLRCKVKKARTSLHMLEEKQSNFFFSL